MLIFLIPSRFFIRSFFDQTINQNRLERLNIQIIRICGFPVYYRLTDFTTVSPPLTHLVRVFTANFNTFYSILLVYEAVKLPKVCQFQPRKSLKSIFQKLFTFFSQESAFMAIKDVNCKV